MSHINESWPILNQRVSADTFIQVACVCIHYKLGESHRVLQHTATHCNTLQHTATHCNTLQHTTNLRYASLVVLQNTAIRCNMLQHTETQKASQNGLTCRTRHISPVRCVCMSVDKDKYTGVYMYIYIYVYIYNYIYIYMYIYYI